MIEKHTEHSLHMHKLFIDFKQAFDSINMGRLFAAMDRTGIPQKLIRLTRMTMRQTKARVKIDNQLGVPFEYDKGVKQGDGCQHPSSYWHYTTQDRKLTREAQSTQSQAKYVRTQMM